MVFNLVCVIVLRRYVFSLLRPENALSAVQVVTGVYDVLTSLEERAFKKALEQNEEKENEVLEQALSQKVIRLKKQRDLYKQKLAQDDVGGASLTSNLVMKLKETQWIYRLLGISVATLDEDTFLVTFTTSYRGVFCESYTAELKHSEDKYVLGKHDFPKFISLEDLFSSLESGIENFFSLVQGRLQAFISRREQLKAVEALYKDELSDYITVFDHSLIIFVMNFNSNDSSGKIRMEVSLSYTDPFSVLPSAAHLNPIDNSVIDKRLLKNWTHIFMSSCLTAAVSQVLADPRRLSLADGNKQS